MNKEVDVLEKYKPTVSKQLRGYVKTLLMFFIVAGFLGSYMVLGMEGWAQKLACAVLIFCQFIVFYATTYDIANHDIKSFSALKPYNWKGFAFSSISVVISVILTVVYKVVWINGTLDNWGEVIGNVLYLFWILPYYTIILPDSGAISILGTVAAVLVPVVGSGLGYYAGKKQFDLSVVMKKYIYERKN